MSQTQLDNVNDHRRAFQQHKGSNGAFISLPETLLPSFWDRVRNLFKWEHNLTVAGRTIEKGWVIPQSLGLLLIATMLSCTGVLYWRIIDKQADQDRVAVEARERQDKEIQKANELLIRLDQRLQDKDRHDQQKFQELEDEFDSVHAWQQVTNKDLARLLPRK
jgi:hypothetical protein